MFDFTLTALLRDVLVAAFCVFIVHFIAYIAVRVFYKWKRADKVSFRDYLNQTLKRPLAVYGLLAFALFLAVYTTKLVVVRMLLALIYAFILVRAFAASDPRA